MKVIVKSIFNVKIILIFRDNLFFFALALWHYYEVDSEWYVLSRSTTSWIQFSANALLSMIIEHKLLEITSQQACCSLENLTEAREVIEQESTNMLGTTNFNTQQFGDRLSPLWNISSYNAIFFIQFITKFCSKNILKIYFYFY